MLYQLGEHQFEVAPLNIHEGEVATAADFATKPVIGARPPLEPVGEGEETRSLRGRMFPKRFGGEAMLSALDASRRAQTPLPLVRGDGAALGFFVITALRRSESAFAGDGVPQVIDFDISLTRSQPAKPEAYDAMQEKLVNG